MKTKAQTTEGTRQRRVGSRSVARQTVQPNAVFMTRGPHPAFAFPSITAHSKIQDSIDNSPMQLAEAARLRSLFRYPAQREVEDEPLQGNLETVQRQSIEEEDPLQGKLDLVQRQVPAEEEPLQGKRSVGPPAQTKEATGGTETQIGLPDHLKTGLEQLSGMDLSDVQVHRNSTKPAQVKALAYAQGNDIHLGPGQGHHLPHEAWHVVQQRQGRVRPTMQMSGVQVNDDPALEQEADVMGSKAQQMTS